MPAPTRTASGVLGGLSGLVGLSAVAGLLASITVTPAIAVSGAAASGAITMFDNLPSVLEIDELMLPTTLYAKSPDSDKYVELTSFYDQNRSPVTYKQITPVMYDALLSSEDPRYYQHGGVDLIGTSRAILTNIRGGSEIQGGSSISQQYVKNVLVQKCERDTTNPDELGQCWEKATESEGTDGYQRKLQEMRYAIALEQRYSKDQILLGYLNIANFGGRTYGVDAAARYYFNVPASKLSLAQAATLAGMVQNPNVFRIDLPESADNGEKNGYKETKQRQLYVLGRMLEDGKITQEQHDEAAEAPIEPKITVPKSGCAATGTMAYFCQYAVSVVRNDPAFGETSEDRELALRRGGLNIYTTMDMELQKDAQAVISEYTSNSVKGLKFGATTVNIEVDTGRILSIVQNTKFTEDPEQAKKPGYTSLVYAGDSTFGGSNGFQAGSTFKLFTLIDWLEKGNSVNQPVDGRNRLIPRVKNSCDGDWVNYEGYIGENFEKQRGYVGTPMKFTAQSLNSGFFGMAEKLDLCDIRKVASRMGVNLAATGEPVQMTNLFSVIGSNAVSPIAMAGAYATVANKGIYCQPKIIDKVTDQYGMKQTLPDRTCKQVISPEVAATAAYALKGVMRGGGSGAFGNPNDGTEVIGKTGTHEQIQTWLIESSTKVTTASWVGNTEGEGDLFKTWSKGYELAQLRYYLSRNVQAAADELYPGGAFPAPDKRLTRVVYVNAPSVVGMSIDKATKTLEAAGFSVSVGKAIDSGQPKGKVAAQSPGAGRVVGGSNISLSPSTGVQTTVPKVAGMTVAQATATLNAAGYGNVVGNCTVRPGASSQVTSSSPSPGAPAAKSATITLNFIDATCGRPPADTGDNGSDTGSNGSDSGSTGTGDTDSSG